MVAWARRKSEGGPREGARATQAVRDASVSHTRNSSMSRTVRDKPHTHGLFPDGGCCPEHCHTLRRCQWRLATRRDSLRQVWSLWAVPCHHHHHNNYNNNRTDSDGWTSARLRSRRSCRLYLQPRVCHVQVGKRLRRKTRETETELEILDGQSTG